MIMNIYARLISNDDEIRLGCKGLYGAQFYSSTDPVDIKNKVMKIVTVNTAHNIKSTTSIAGKSLCQEPCTFEFDMKHYFEVIPWFYSRFYFRLEFRNKAQVSMFSISFETANTTLGQSPVNELVMILPDGSEVEGFRLRAGEWYRLKIEYYYNPKNPEKSCLKIFHAHDGAVPVLIFNGIVGGRSGVITHAAMIHSATKIKGVQYFDDISFTMTEKGYSPSPVLIERPREELKIYDFESGIPSSRDFNIDMILKKYDDIFPLDPSLWITETKNNPLKHTHDFYEIMTVISGGGRFFTEDEEYDIGVGSIIVVCPGVSHGIASEENYKIISVSGRFEKLSCIDRCCVIQDNAKGEGKTLSELILFNRFNNEDYLNSLCDVFLKYVMLNVEYNIKNTTVSIYKIIAQMEKGFMNGDLSIGRLLDASGYTKDYIRNEFLKVIGMTPKKYLTAIRMKNAKALLDLYGEDMSIGEIAERCGILEPSVFSRIFKKYYGIAPTEYRSEKKK